jgi:hypothetical protein
MTLPPIMRPERIGTAGRRAEKRAARRLGAVQTPASGALAGAKGDMALPLVLIEAKSTTADSMALRLDWLAKITGEALALGKQPAVQLVFVTGNGRPRRFGAWVLVPEHVFKEMAG